MKALTLALCILALLGSAASGYFWWSIGNTKKDLQTQLASEQTRANGLQSNLTQANATIDQKNAEALKLDADLSDAKRSLTAAQAANVQATREIDSLKRSVAAKEETERKLNADLDQLRRELVQTRLAAQVGSPEELEKAKQTIASLETRIAELQANPGALSAAASAATGSAPGAAAAAQPPAPTERASAARVAQVGVKNAFVVIEVGTNDGVAVGNKFAITRDGQTIAEAVVSEVKDTFAIAQVAPASIKTTLRAGDVASYQK